MVLSSTRVFGYLDPLDLTALFLKPFEQAPRDLRSKPKGPSTQGYDSWYRKPAQSISGFIGPSGLG